MSSELLSDLASLRLPAGANPKSTARRFIRTGLLLVGVGVLSCALSYGAFHLASTSKTSRIQVELAVVTSPLTVTPTTDLNATGYVVPQRVTRVSARISGHVASVQVREGDSVAVGASLMTLDADEQRRSLNAALAKSTAVQARVEMARASVAEVEIQIRRTEKLIELSATPASLLQDLQARSAVLTAQLRVAEKDSDTSRAESEILRFNVEHALIVAPVAGIVVSKPASIGELVGPTTQPVLEIAEPESLMVEADVPELRLGQIKISQPCEIILDAYPDKQYHGRVARISPRVNRAKATVVTYVQFDDRNALVLPDMAARISFLVPPPPQERALSPQASVIPRKAVVERQGRSVVFVVNQGHVQQTQVVLGRSMGEQVELVSGPLKGTPIVLQPPDSLADGQGVEAKR